mgnify:CR=1 FL=1
METLKTLFRQWAGEPCVEALAIGAGGSSRRYFRLLAASGRSAIGAIASDRRENEAFFAFTRHLHAKERSRKYHVSAMLSCIAPATQ